MTKTEKASIGIVILALCISAVLLFSQTTSVASATGPFYTNLAVNATTTQSFSVTSSTRILATSTSGIGQSYTRVYASICNPNANPVYLNMNADQVASSSAGYTTVIAAAAGYNACYEITDRNTYNGSVQASSTNQTATVISVQQFVQ